MDTVVLAGEKPGRVLLAWTRLEHTEEGAATGDKETNMARRQGQ